MTEEVIVRMSLDELDTGNLRLLTSFPALGTYILPIIP